MSNSFEFNRFLGRDSSSTYHQPSYRNQASENWSFQTELSQSNLPIHSHHNELYTKIQASYHAVPNNPVLQHSGFADRPTHLMSNQFTEQIRFPTPGMNSSFIDFKPQGLSVGHDIASACHSTGATILPIRPVETTGLNIPESIPYNRLGNQSPFIPVNQESFSNQPVQTSQRLKQQPGSQLLILSNSSNRSHLTINHDSIIPVGSHHSSQPSTFFRSQTLNSTSPHQNHADASSKSIFETRDQYDIHSSFVGRNPVNPSIGRFDSVVPSISKFSPTNNTVTVQNFDVPSATNILNPSSLPTRHKILINPHFKGVQVKSDGKLFNILISKILVVGNMKS